jgi:hypothetical protein
MWGERGNNSGGATIINATNVVVTKLEQVTLEKVKIMLAQFEKRARSDEAAHAPPRPAGSEISWALDKYSKKAISGLIRNASKNGVRYWDQALHPYDPAHWDLTNRWWMQLAPVKLCEMLVEILSAGTKTNLSLGISKVHRVEESLKSIKLIIHIQANGEGGRECAYQFQNRIVKAIIETDADSLVGWTESERCLRMKKFLTDFDKPDRDERPLPFTPVLTSIKEVVLAKFTDMKKFHNFTHLQEVLYDEICGALDVLDRAR